jgi:lipopolysaccharide export LptBFGC system permease protein LptF
LAVAAVFSGLTFVSNAQVVPRANARLKAMVTGQAQPRSDREMTLGELWEAARTARATPGGDTSARAAFFETEIHKKIAIPTACVILALLGAATAIRFPRGGAGLFLGASVVVFTGYFMALVGGEQLADRQVISPPVAMWMANGSLLAIALLLTWLPSRTAPPGGMETLAVDG